MIKTISDSLGYVKHRKLLQKLILPLILIILIGIFVLNQLLTGSIKDFVTNFLVQKSFLPHFTALALEKDKRFKEIKLITYTTAQKLYNRISDNAPPEPEKVDQQFQSFMKQAPDGSYRSSTDDRSRRLQMLAFRNNIGNPTLLEKRIITDAFNYFLPYAEALTNTVYNTYFTTDHLIWTYGAHDWPLVVEPDEDFREQIWYRSARPENNSTREHQWTDMYYDSVNREWMISSLCPVYLDNNFVGVVGHDFLLRDIIDLGRAVSSQKDVLIFFLDQKGNIIAHPETQFIIDQHVENNKVLTAKSLSDSSLTNVLKTLNKSGAPRFVFTGDQDGNRLLLHFPLKSINWELVYIVNETEIFSVIQNINSAHIISFVLMSVFIFLLLAFMIKQIILKPLYSMIVGIENFEAGRLDTIIPGNERKDEFGNVIRALNEMAMALKDYRDKLISANRELMESSQNLQVLKDTTPDAVFIYTEEGSIVDVNRTTLTMFEYSKPEIIRLSMSQLSADGFSEYRAAKHFQTALDKGESHFEWMSCSKKGKIFPTMIRLKRMIVNDTTFILAVVTDISEQKQAEKALKSSEERYRYLIERSNDAIYVLYERKFEIINQKFTEIFGLSLNDVNKSGFDFMDLVAPRSIPVIEERMKRIKNGDDLNPNYEFTAISKDGKEIEVEASVSYIEYNDGIATQGILRDITQRKAMEQQLRQSQKLEAIGTLAGGVAHDFNNLLTVINGHAEIGLMKLEKKDAAYRDMKSILKAGKQAEKVTGQLLAFSRRQIYEPKILNINTIINGLQNMLRRMIGEDIEIRIRSYPKIPPIKADPGQIEQTLINLVINARDAILENQDTSSPKKITIVTDIAHLKKEDIGPYDDLSAGPYVVISVNDTGIGMNKELTTKIFEPFFTTKSAGKGTGLGLATVYGIVKQNGGDITVKSEIRRGTSISIYWPVTESVQESSKSKPESIKVFTGNEKIMLVEDDHGVRSFASNALKQLGYTVLVAENGKIALDIITKNGHDLDLLVTDLIMPEMNGKELVNAVSDIFPAMKVLYTSGYTDDHIVHSGALDEGIAFLSKPYSAQNLSRRIREILDEPA